VLQWLDRMQFELGFGPTPSRKRLEEYGHGEDIDTSRDEHTGTSVSRGIDIEDRTSYWEDGTPNARGDDHLRTPRSTMIVQPKLCGRTAMWCRVRAPLNYQLTKRSSKLTGCRAAQPERDQVQPEPHEAAAGRPDRRIFGCSSSTCRGLCAHARRCCYTSWALALS
jgi:hypothetical protein